jgi:hypothetical protein
MPVISNWELQLDVDQVLRAQGCDPEIVSERSPALAGLALRAFKEGMPLLKPVVAYQEYRIKSIHHEKVLFSDGTFISGKAVALHLAGARSAAVVYCSLGELFDTFVKAIFKDDPAYGLALDAFGSAAVQFLSTSSCTYLGEKAADKGWETSLPLSPGSEGWPVDKAHQTLFGLLDPALAGIRYTSSGMMSPLKSLSFVLGFGPEIDNSGRVCDYCSMRNSCRYQDSYTNVAHP